VLQLEYLIRGVGAVALTMLLVTSLLTTYYVIACTCVRGLVSIGLGSSELLNISGTSNSVAVVVSDKLLCAEKYLGLLYKLVGINYKFFPMRKVLMMFPRGREDESLRAFARYVRYVMHYRYLVIVGDDIDYAYIYMKDKYSDIEGALKATDMYYSLLDFSWDPNHDGYLLEFIDLNGDGVPEAIEELKDLTPDLLVTRLPFSNCYEVRNYAYSVVNALAKGGEGFKVLLVASILKFPNEGGSEYLVDGASVTELVKSVINSSVPNTEFLKLYEGSGVLKSRYRYDEPLSKDSFSNALSKGYPLIYVVSHGNGMKLARYVWVSDRNRDGRFEINELATPVYASYDSIPKLGYPSLIYLDTCLAGATDLMGEKALATAFLIRGASGVIAATRTTYFSNYLGSGIPRLSQEIMYLFTKYLISSYPRLNPVVAFYEAIATYMREHLSSSQYFEDVKDALTYVYFGDPVATELVLNLATGYLRSYGVYLRGDELLLGIKYGNAPSVNTYLIDLRNYSVKVINGGPNELINLRYYLLIKYLEMKLLSTTYLIKDPVIK